MKTYLLAATVVVAASMPAEATRYLDISYQGRVKVGTAPIAPWEQGIVGDLYDITATLRFALDDNNAFLGGADWLLSNGATGLYQGITTTIPTDAGAYRLDIYVLPGNYSSTITGLNGKITYFGVGPTGVYQALSPELANNFPGVTYKATYTISESVDSLPTGLLSLDLGNHIAASWLPEPSTWLLMIVGLGLTGAALRRRRYLVAFA